MDLDKFARMAAVPLRVLGLALLALGAFSVTAQAQIPPSVIPFIDLKCYGITDPNGLPLPPLNFPLHLDHLNPIFHELAPPEDVIVLEPFQLCVPVAKNGVNPPPDALQFIQFIDLKCYHMEADPNPLNLLLVLSHLNPVLRQLPPELVSVQESQKLCVPVAKALPDGTPFLPPPPILNSIQFIDQKCYGITDPNGLPLPPLNFPLHLDHLNPLLRPPVAPPEDVIMQDPQQLCVPVAKNGQFPSPPDFPVISQIDLKCYAIVDRTTGLPGDPLNLPQTLFHLNPVLRNQDPEPVLIQEPQQLCVPVQKSRPPPPMVPSVKKPAPRG